MKNEVQYMKIISLIMFFFLPIVTFANSSNSYKSNYKYLTGLPINYCKNEESKRHSRFGNELNARKGYGPRVLRVRRIRIHPDGRREVLEDKKVDDIKGDNKKVDDNINLNRFDQVPGGIRRFFERKIKDVNHKPSPSSRPSSKNAKTGWERYQVEGFDGNEMFLSEKGTNKVIDMLKSERKFDWLKKNKKCFGDLGDYSQGTCGSCFVFSTVNYYTTMNCFQKGSITYFSHQDIVSCAPSIGASPNNCEGGHPGPTFDYIANNGILEQSCRCYSSFDFQSKRTVAPCKRDSCDDGGSPKLHKPEVTGFLTTSKISMLIYLLKNHGIAMGGISIKAEDVERLNNFSRNKNKKTGKQKMDMQNMFGGVAARGEHSGHAVVFIAYRIRDDKEECKELIDPQTQDIKRSCVHFKIVNSWAASWGKKGFAWIPSEMVDDSAIGFPYNEQKENLIKKMNDGDFKLQRVNVNYQRYKCFSQ